MKLLVEEGEPARIPQLTRDLLCACLGIYHHHGFLSLARSFSDMDSTDIRASFKTGPKWCRSCRFPMPTGVCVSWVSNLPRHYLNGLLRKHALVLCVDC